MNSLKERKKRIRGILFDKDGTLIDFNTFWVPLAFELAGKLLSESKLGPEHRISLLGHIGIRPDGNIIQDSIYASGTLEDTAQALYLYMKEQGCRLPGIDGFKGTLEKMIRAYAMAQRSKIRSIGNVKETLSALNEKGLLLGISTSDSEENTRLCLEETELISCFRYIGCPGYSKRPKPSGDILFDFSAKFKVAPEEIAVVGDTYTDIAFARENHAGIAVGVLSGAGTAQSLSGSDILLRDVNELVAFFGG